MKNIMNGKCFVAALALGSLSLTGCIEETVPLSSTATSDQLGASAKATEALLAAPTAFINNFGTYDSDRHYDWGYGSIMHIRDVMTADMTVVSHGYNWYTAWSTNDALDERTVYTGFPNLYFTKAIQTANNILKAIDFEKASDEQKGQYAVGSAWRAFFYLDAARMYEFLPNDKTSNITPEGKDITHLTMPIVTEKTGEKEARNNPRATREEMFKFIENDLNVAEQNIGLLNEEDDDEDRTAPTLASIYGLKARLYMWVEDYEQAATYARKAIALGQNKPMTKDECLNTSTGFNTGVSSWMLYSQLTPDDRVVTSKLLNWTSWMSNETTYGYSCAGPFVMIGSDLYDKIPTDDFRKLWFKAPATSPLAGTEPVVRRDLYNAMPTYSSLKFRPGEGNPEDYKIASVVAFPLMRIEEMYFIEAEAKAHANAAEGKSLLESFVKSYRNPSYSCKANAREDVIREIITQKSIEFFGEGLSFFDIKRLNYSVDRTLNKNVDPSERFKTEGRPAWMNFCLLYTERINNKGLEGFQNPDPSGAYKPVE